jgi:hypothetical protein
MNVSNPFQNGSYNLNQSNFGRLEHLFYQFITVTFVLMGCFAAEK